MRGHSSQDWLNRLQFCFNREKKTVLKGPITSNKCNTRLKRRRVTKWTNSALMYQLYEQNLM